MAASDRATSRIVPLDAARRARAEGHAAPSPPDRDTETLAEAYTRLREPLKAFLHRRTGDAGVAEELVQDLWLRIVAREGAPAPVLDNADAWLQRIAANLAIDWLRKRRFRSSFQANGVDVSAVADGQPDADRYLAGRQQLEYLRVLIDKLPPKRRQAFLLYRGQGLSLKEAAAELGTAPQTVRLQAARALADLRQALADAGLWP